MSPHLGAVLILVTIIVPLFATVKKADFSFSNPILMFATGGFLSYGVSSFNSAFLRLDDELLVYRILRVAPVDVSPTVTIICASMCAFWSGVFLSYKAAAKYRFAPRPLRTTVPRAYWVVTFGIAIVLELTMFVSEGWFGINKDIIANHVVLFFLLSAISRLVVVWAACSWKRSYSAVVGTVLLWLPLLSAGMTIGLFISWLSTKAFVDRRKVTLAAAAGVVCLIPLFAILHWSSKVYRAGGVVESAAEVYELRHHLLELYVVNTQRFYGYHAVGYIYSRNIHYGPSFIPLKSLWFGEDPRTIAQKMVYDMMGSAGEDYGATSPSLVGECVSIGGPLVAIVALFAVGFILNYYYIKNRCGYQCVIQAGVFNSILVFFAQTSNDAYLSLVINHIVLYLVVYLGILGCYKITMGRSSRFLVVTADRG